MRVMMSVMLMGGHFDMEDEWSEAGTPVGYLVESRKSKFLCCLLGMPSSARSLCVMVARSQPRIE